MSFISTVWRLALTGAVIAALAGCSALTGQAKLAVPPEARVTGMSADAGSLAGGGTVTVTGTALSEVVSISFGSQDAQSLTHLDDSSLTVVVPHSLTYVPGTVTVSFETTAGHDPEQRATGLEYSYEVRTAVDSQLQYAFAHWNDYNLAKYGDFTTWGGDCMNFVSQTLVARGWSTTSDWYNSAQEDWAPAFVDVPSFDAWLTAHPEYGAVRLPMSARDQLKIGDIVMMDWNSDGSLDHAQIVSGIEHVNGVTRILMVGHDIDTDYRDLDDALASEGQPGAVAYFWSLPAA